MAQADSAETQSRPFAVTKASAMRRSDCGGGLGLRDKNQKQIPGLDYVA